MRLLNNTTFFKIKCKLFKKLFKIFKKSFALTKIQTKILFICKKSSIIFFKKIQ